MNKTKFSRLFKVSLRHPLFKLWEFVEKIERHIYIVRPKFTTNEQYCLKVYTRREPRITDESLLAEYFSTLGISPRIYATLQLTNQYNCIIMEYLGPNSDLFTKIIRNNAELTSNDLYEIVDKTLNHLITLNKLGFTHGDIKPDNIFLSKEGKILLGDFGLTLYGKQHKSKDNGTVNYMAPEVQSRKTNYNEKCDIWSLGCTIIELITKKRTFSTQMINDQKMAIELNREIPQAHFDKLLVQNTQFKDLILFLKENVFVAEIKRINASGFLEALPTLLNSDVQN